MGYDKILVFLLPQRPNERGIFYDVFIVNCRLCIPYKGSRFICGGCWFFGSFSENT